jgi:eukaryotic-like serine/threonine-protein kinase
MRATLMDSVDEGGWGGGSPQIGATASSAYAPGDCIAERYLLLRVLERGGMGVVWVAHHLALDVHVALKLIRPDAGSQEAARRLRPGPLRAPDDRRERGPHRSHLG